MLRSIRSYPSVLGSSGVLVALLAMTPAFAGGAGLSVAPSPVGEQSEVKSDSQGRPNLCWVSDLIVIGTVGGSESRRVEAKYATRVFTLSTLRVNSVIRGLIGDGDQLDFDLEGGESDGIRESVSGVVSGNDGGFCPETLAASGA